jgi:type II secretory pathway pseudopilin PulG
MKSRDSQRKSDLGQIAKSLEMYYNDKGKYPTAQSGLIANIAWGSAFKDTSTANGATYMVKLPKDPGSTTYYYFSDVNGTGYKLYANLENTRDKDVPKDADNNPILYAGTNCGNAVECNYGIASSNLTP